MYVTVRTHACTCEHQEICANMKLAGCWSNVYVIVYTHTFTLLCREITGSARMELTNLGTVMVVPMRVNGMSTTSCNIALCI